MEPVPPGRPARAPNIRDVALRAGVGVATVSRVLNGSSRVSVQTNLRVREAIDALGYRRNLSARSLAVGRSEAIGVVAPFFTSPSVVERVRGVASRLSARGYDLVLFDVETPAQRADAFATFARRDRVAALLVISLPPTDDEVELLRAEGLPVVLLDSSHRDLPHISIDDVAGGELAARHLLAKGHRRIGFVGDDPINVFGFTSSERRRAGFRAALAAAGVTLAPEFERLGRPDRASARALAHSLLVSEPRPTAVFVASDVQAVGVLEAAAMLGLDVPADVAVMGFDDIELAGMLELTTIRQPLAETGEMAAERVMDALESGQPMTGAIVSELAVVERLTT
jgi:LacI family transcriptional regulator/LacI family repressor for deo operon, udp, cdd, tsx, nupC, and nupG